MLLTTPGPRRTGCLRRSARAAPPQPWRTPMTRSRSGGRSRSSGAWSSGSSAALQPAPCLLLFESEIHGCRGVCCRGVCSSDLCGYKTVAEAAAVFLQGCGGSAAHGAVGGHLAERRGAHRRRHRRRRGALQRPRVAGVPAGRQPQVHAMLDSLHRHGTDHRSEVIGVRTDINALAAVQGAQHAHPSAGRLILMPCRATLLADHERNSHEEAAEPGTSDLASAPDYQTVLDQVQIPWHPCWQAP
jgi:hypothetical protein